MKATRLITPLRFTDPEEVAADVNSKLGSAVGQSSPAPWLFEDNKGGLEPTLVVDAARPSDSPSLSGSRVYKGGAEVGR